MTSNTSSGGGLGVIGALTLIFVVLKLTHVIDWSWWWVLSPVWISSAASVLVLLIIALMVVIADWLDRRG